MMVVAAKGPIALIDEGRFVGGFGNGDRQPVAARPETVITPPGRCSRQKIRYCRGDVVGN